MGGQDLQLCTFLQFVADGHPKEYYAPAVLGGHSFLCEDLVQSPACSLSHWALLFEPALYCFLVRHGRYQRGERWDMYALMSGLAASAFERFGDSWPSAILLAWPSDLAHCPGAAASARSLNALTESCSEPVAYVIPIATAGHWAVLVFRPPCNGRSEWDVVHLDSQTTDAMREIAAASSLQVVETCGLPIEDVTAKLKDVPVPQQPDAWSCGPRVAWMVRQCLAVPCAHTLTADHFSTPFSETASLEQLERLTGHVASATMPFWRQHANNAADIAPHMVPRGGASKETAGPPPSGDQRAFLDSPLGCFSGLDVSTPADMVAGGECSSTAAQCTHQGGAGSTSAAADGDESQATALDPIAAQQAAVPKEEAAVPQQKAAAPGLDWAAYREQQRLEHIRWHSRSQPQHARCAANEVPPKAPEPALLDAARGGVSRGQKRARVAADAPQARALPSPARARQRLNADDPPSSVGGCAGDPSPPGSTVSFAEPAGAAAAAAAPPRGLVAGGLLADQRAAPHLGGSVPAADHCDGRRASPSTEGAARGAADRSRGWRQSAADYGRRALKEIRADKDPGDSFQKSLGCAVRKVRDHVSTAHGGMEQMMDDPQALEELFCTLTETTYVSALRLGPRAI